MPRRPLARAAVYALSALLIAALPPPAARAAILSTQSVIDGAARSASLARVQRALDGQRVHDLLLAQGVTTTQLNERLAGLSDAELASLADRIERQPAGGDSLFAVLGIVFVVLLVLDLTGTVDIFKRSHKPHR